MRGANRRSVHAGGFWRRVLRQKSNGSREAVHVALPEEHGGHREGKKTAGKGLGGTPRSCFTSRKLSGGAGFIIRKLSGGAGRKVRVE